MRFFPLNNDYDNKAGDFSEFVQYWTEINPFLGQLDDSDVHVNNFAKTSVLLYK